MIRYEFFMAMLNLLCATARLLCIIMVIGIDDCNSEIYIQQYTCKQNKLQ